MKLYSLILFFTVFVAFSQNAIGQVTEEQARQVLEEKDISEDEVRERLLLKGIDLDNVDVTDPAELLRIENTIQETISEIEAEKRQNELQKAEIPETVAELDSIKENTENEMELLELEEENESDTIEMQALIYGQHIFQDKTLKLFKQSDQIKTTDAYILSTGDEIGISIWGVSQESQSYEIDDDGYIVPNKMEPIYLKGMNYGEAKEILKKRFQQYYRFKSNEFKATLASERELNINIVGEVEQSGAYSMSSKNTAINALVAAGGPTSIGSVRKIKLLKPGSPEKIVDVYKYLNNPNLSEGFYLENNDVILVPVAGRIITLEGAVIRPAKYELINGEDLLELFEIAGGFKANAILQNIQIKRFSKDEEEIIDVNLNELMSSNRDFELKNGDVVLVNEITKEFENYVSVFGAVTVPGKYSIGEKTSLRDVLKKVNIQPDALTDIAYIKRYNQDNKSAKYIFFNLDEVQSGKSSINYLMKPRDEITINAQSRFADNQNFYVTGAVREPGEFLIDDSGSITFSQAIFIAGGLRKDASEIAYIKRRKFPASKQISYIRIDIEDALKEGKNDVRIMNGDNISIYSKINDDDEVNVNIEGAVRRPGKFTYDASLNLRDILSMAGGFKISAAPYKIDVYRLVFDDQKKSRTLAAHISVSEDFENDDAQYFELKPFDQIYVREAPEFEFHKTVNLVGEVKYKGKYPILSDNEKLTDVIERAGGLTDEAFAKGTTLFRTIDSLGYVVIDLETALKDYNSPYNLVLQAGDRITIPKTSNIVTIIGETKAKDLTGNVLTNNGVIHAPYQKGKPASYYIQKYAGGIGENGKSSLVTVTFPTGDVKTSSRFLFFKKSPEVRPGSIIKVGSKKEKIFGQKEKNETDWGKVLTDSVAQATAILSLVLLVQRVD